MWKAVLGATRACCPPAWPQLLEPLRGLQKAAALAGDTAAAEAAASELRAVLQVLNPGCDDLGPA